MKPTEEEAASLSGKLHPTLSARAEIGIISETLDRVRDDALKKVEEIAEYHAGIFGDLNYERAAKDIYNAVHALRTKK